jgi:hypothetical protein
MYQTLRSELNNLAKSNPEMVQKLNDKYMVYCNRADVIPTFGKKRQQQRKETKERKARKEREQAREQG